MRRELASLLNELVERNRRVELQVDVQFNRFPMPPSCRVEGLEEFQDLIARFFRQLLCPELGVKEDWKRQREHLCSQAFILLKDEYGANAGLRTFDLARSGAEGGLLAVMRALSRHLQSELFQRASLDLVDRYWYSTPADQLVKDGQDYLKDFGHLLPGEMTEGSGAALLTNFRKVLLEHPNLIRGIRTAIRR